MQTGSHRRHSAGGPSTQDNGRIADSTTERHPTPPPDPRNQQAPRVLHSAGTAMRAIADDCGSQAAKRSTAAGHQSSSGPRDIDSVRVNNPWSFHSLASTVNRHPHTTAQSPHPSLRPSGGGSDSERSDPQRWIAGFAQLGLAVEPICQSALLSRASGGNTLRPEEQD